MENTIRIMIADDFPLLREDLAEKLGREADIEVAGQAASGKEAVSEAMRLLPDMILMDIEMEQVNSGIKATEAILEALPATKIIFLTAHETKEMIVTAMGAGACDYVVKGVTAEELLLHIRAAAKGEPMMQSKIHDIILTEYARLQKSERSLLYFINNISKLTGAERETIKYLLQGYKAHEIAEARCVELSTIKTQIKSLLRKFDCGRTKEITKLIRELNIEHLF